MRTLIFLSLACACSHPSNAQRDAATVSPDAETDAAAVDATVPADAPIDAAPAIPRRLALAAIGSRTNVRVYVATETSFRKVVDISDPLGSGTGIAWTDYDSDGRDDLVSIFGTLDEQNQLLIVHNDGSSGLSPAGSRTMNPAVLLGYDAEADGDGDVYVGMQGGPDMLFRSDGTALPPYYSWGEPGNSAWEYGIASGDMTGDGRPEVVLARGPYGEAIHRGTMGAPSPSWSQAVPDMFDATDAAMIDFDQDGRLDASFSTSNFLHSQGGIEIFRWNGSQFVSSASITQLGPVMRLDWADIDNDGDADLALCGPSDTLRIYMRDGMDFAANAINDSNLPCGDLAWGDYDIDGDPDLAVTGNGVTIYNNTAAIFAPVFHDDTSSRVLAWGRCGDDSDECFVDAPTL